MQLKVHQSLHGYSAGHRMLGSSVSLDPVDAKTVLVMSDISGPGVFSSGVSYITGYPLLESDLFAIARTWPATELARPGCVWTHTLYIEFSDLARLKRASLINGLFKRPGLGDGDSYTTDIWTNLQQQDDQISLDSNELKWTAKLLNAIYGAPALGIIAPRLKDERSEELVLRIWEQQWPRLRRSFRFCTLTSTDRSFGGDDFDLQLVSAEGRRTLSRKQSLVDFEDVQAPDQWEWLALLASDLTNSTNTALRSVLRTLGTDLLGHRNAMKPICELYVALEINKNKQNLRRALALVSEHGELRHSDSAKELVGRMILSKLPNTDHESINFLAGHLPMLAGQVSEDQTSELADVILRYSPGSLIEITRPKSGSIRQFAERLLRSLSSSQIGQAWEHLEGGWGSLLQVRTDLLEDPLFWRASQALPTAIPKGELSEGAIAAAIIGLSNDTVIRSWVRHLTADRTMIAIDALKDSPNLLTVQDQIWIEACCKDTFAISRFLNRGPRSQWILRKITEFLDPGAVPNDYGRDPWVEALSHYANEPALHPRLLAYGFSRAFSGRSLQNQDLLHLTFQGLHDQLAKAPLDKKSWGFVEAYSPKLPLKNEWDKCLYVRQLVAYICVSGRVWPGAFPYLTRTNELFQQLVRETALIHGGRSYLRDVDKTIRKDVDPAILYRKSIIRSSLKKDVFDSFLKAEKELPFDESQD